MGTGKDDEICGRTFASFICTSPPHEGDLHYWEENYTSLTLF